MSMFQTFESNAHQWMHRYTTGTEEWSQNCLRDRPRPDQSFLERYILNLMEADPPIYLPSIGQGSYLNAGSENLVETESGRGSYEPDPKLGETIGVPIGRNKVKALPPGLIDGDNGFERQDAETVRMRIEHIDKYYIALGGNLYQIREVVDHWLPIDGIANGRATWLPSRLVEEARVRTLHELTFITVCFTDHVQDLNNCLGQIREGAFGGRLNTKSVAEAKEMYEVLRELRRLVLRIQAPASDRTVALKDNVMWFETKCLPALLEVREPYEPERFDPNDPKCANIGQMFDQHMAGIIQTFKYCAQAFVRLSEVFETIDCICKTMIEGLKKLLEDVHDGETTGQFIASWVSRWERVTFVLLVKLLGLPALHSGLEHDFPGYDEI